MRDVRKCTQAVVANGMIEVVIAPPTLYLLLAREHLRPGLEVAAQNVFDKPNGAFTGEISVDQLKESGITWAILGHSERRVILQESDDFVANKTKAAIDGGLGVILCCGESLEQRESEKTVDVVTSQLKAVVDKVKDWSKIVVAYEPIWYIHPSPSPFFFFPYQLSNLVLGLSAPAKSQPQRKPKKSTPPSAIGSRRRSQPRQQRRPAFYTEEA
jgi:triosephosphate isomerase